MPFDSIQASVGKYHSGATNCYNLAADVAIVVKLLNFIAQADGGTNENKIGGTPSPDQLYTSILRFQQTQNNLGQTPRLSVDGHVDPWGLTLSRLNQLARKIGPVDPLDFPQDLPPFTPLPLFTTDWQFVDVSEVTLALGPARFGSGQIRVKNSEDVIGLNFVSEGAQLGGLSPTPRIPGDDAVVKIMDLLRGNMNSFIKLFTSPNGSAPRLGSILRNPHRVSGELQLKHLAEGAMVLFKGEIGVVNPGISASLIFFGMPNAVLITNSGLPFLAGLGLFEFLVETLVKGRFELQPTAIGLFGKVSTVVGGSVSVSTAKITSAEFI